MIIVTGVTGNLGRAVVRKLLERLPADRIGASARDPAKAADLVELGVRIRQADFEQPDSLMFAFEGARQLLLVSSNARAYGGDPLTQHRAAIEAAHAVGAQRVVYTSHMAASDSSAFPPMLDHYETEELLRRSGLRWTALRNGFYAASGLALMGDAFERGVLESPADGKVAWTTHADLAEAAAIMLTNDVGYEGPTPSLTGADMLDFADLAEIATELLGRPITRKIISDDDLRARLAARGAPAGAAQFVLGMAIASRNGEFGPPDPTLEQLLRRRPASIRDLIAEKVSAAQRNDGQFIRLSTRRSPDG